MEVLYPRCAGLDVHQQSVAVCARVASGTAIQQEVRTFGTTTGELLALADWLTAHGCTHVAMESTGVYWKPVWHVLDGQFELILANALQIRSVPGRKTDVNDAMWIADLLAHGLIRSSFVPPAPIHELRDLTRTRKQLVREVSQHTLRIQKVLEDANIKLTSVLSDLMGQSGRAMIEALIRGEQDSERLADLSQGTAEGLPSRRPCRAAGLRDGPSPIPLAPPSDADRRAQRCGARGGGALGRSPRALSSRRRPTDDDSRGGSNGRPRHRGGNRTGHEPLSHSGSLGLVGRSLSSSARECGQAALDADATR